MQPLPHTISELETLFPTEETCREFLAQLRWPNGYVCPRCHHNGVWQAFRGRLLCHKCRYQASVTAGTIFQDSHKPLQTWFRAIWYVASQETASSATGLQEFLNLGSYPTAWTWLHKLRRAMVRPGQDRLRGQVEVDHLELGGGKRPARLRRRTADTVFVAIAVEQDGREIGRVRLTQLPDLTRKSLHRFIRQAVVPKKSIVRTNNCRAYRGLTRFGYLHEDVVLPNLGKDDVLGLLPQVHEVALQLQQWLLETHRGALRPEHLSYYLAEFGFRFSHRRTKSPGERFRRLLEQALEVEPAPFREIVARKPSPARLIPRPRIMD